MGDWGTGEGGGGWGCEGVSEWGGSGEEYVVEGGGRLRVDDPELE